MGTALATKSVSKANEIVKMKSKRSQLIFQVEPLKYVLPDKIIRDHYAKDIKGIHPIANIFPLATEEEHQVLCQSIVQYGLDKPLVREKKTKLLLDGRSRLMACFAVNEKLRFEDISLEGSQTATNQPEGYVPAKAIDFEWIYDVITQCKEQGVPYYLKANCNNIILTKSKPRVK